MFDIPRIRNVSATARDRFDNTSSVRNAVGSKFISIKMVSNTIPSFILICASSIGNCQFRIPTLDQGSVQ